MLDYGWIYPMNSRPHCLKGVSVLTGTKGNAGIFFFPENSWKGLQALTLALTSVNIFGQ